MVLKTRQPPSFGAMYRRKNAHDLQGDSILSGPLRTLELAFKEVEARKAEAYRRGMFPDHATIIEHGPIRILLSGTPNPAALRGYADKLAQYNVKHVVRVCEQTYNAADLENFGLSLHEMPFSDGEAPPDDVISGWLALLNQIFDIRHHQRASSPSSLTSDLSSDSDNSASAIQAPPKETIAIHCAAGLGRAPVLAAIALVELGVDPFDAVGWVRALRRGAINATQMAFVETYSRRPRQETRKRKSNSSRSGSFVGAFWLKAARPFRPRSPSQAVSSVSSPATSRRNSNSSTGRPSE